MALSGSVETNKYEGARYYQVTWTATQDKANNKSTISYEVKAVGRTSDTAWWAERTLKVVIAGTTVIDKTNYVERWEGTIKTGTITVSHDTNGNKSFDISIQAAVYVSSISCSGSKSFTLDQILRKSTLAASNGTLGTSQKLTVTKQSSSFTHTITYTCGNATGTICTKSSATSIDWTPPLNLAAQNTTGEKVSITLKIETFNGSTSLGSNTKTISCDIPSSVIPSVSFTLADAMGYSGTYGGYVQGISKFKIAVTASGNQGSTIKSYKVVADGKTYADASITTDVINGSGTLTIQVTVTDSRGRTNTATKTATVLAYAVPKISDISTVRCNSDGTPNSTGAYLKIIFSAAITSLNSKNTATYVLKYKKASDSTCTTVTLTSFTGNYSVTNGTYIFAADTASSYDVTLTATDAFNSSSRSTTGNSSSKLFSFLAKGMGFAFGKVAELTGYLDVAFKTMFRDHVYFKNDKDIYGTTSSGATHNVFSPMDSNGNTCIGYGPYSASIGATYIYGNVIKFFSKTYSEFDKPVRISHSGDASGNADGDPALIIGNPTGNHIAFDNNEIMAKSNASTPSNLILNADGGGVFMNGMQFGANKVLWSGTQYMTSGHTATLSEAVSAQPHGILVAWSSYDTSSGTPHDYDWHWFFVPKHHVSLSGSKGVFMADAFRGMDSYVYVLDTVINGYSGNNTSGNQNGIAKVQYKWVMRYVIGV